MMAFTRKLTLKPDLDALRSCLRGVDVFVKCRSVGARHALRGALAARIVNFVAVMLNVCLACDSVRAGVAIEAMSLRRIAGV